MIATENKLVRFLEGHDKIFIIPVYQRNYDWRKENCMRLLTDLYDLYKHNRRSHFFGSLVVIYNDDGEGQEYIVIDGQQRITTISLLLFALVNISKEKNIPEEVIDTKLIINEYLLGKYSKEEKVKLKPVKNDKTAFINLFTKNITDVPSNITRNYKLFYEEINKYNAEELAGIYASIKKLDIVEIKLKKGEDDPQLIFESLNSTGLDLTEADKVRNFILMNLKTSEQEYYYENHWNVIEENTYYDVSSFLRDYITLKESSVPNKDKVYTSFREYFYKYFNNDKTTELVKELHKYSVYYKTIITSNSAYPSISDCLKKLNRLDVSVAYPYLMDVFEDLSKQLLKVEEVVEVLNILETFILRRFMCEVATNALNKIFMTLAREIKKNESYVDNYVEILKFVLLHKKGSQRFPLDDEFYNKLLLRDIYNLKSKNKVFFLERLENYNNREQVDIQKMLDNCQLSIEHVMPQTLTPAWRKYLGDNWENVYTKYLHSLGNITLSAYNSELSNKQYHDKLTQKDGLLSSKLYLNSTFRSFNDWNEKNIISRAETLTKKALEIWPLPISHYNKVKTIESVYGLNEDNCFTGEKIIGFSFWGIDYKVDTWIDFYRMIISLLLDLEPQRVYELVDDIDFNKNLIISRTEGELRKSTKLADDLYIERNLSTESILGYARQFLQRFNIDESEINIFLKEKEV